MILNIKGETQIVLKVTGQIDFVSHIDWSNWLWYDNIDFTKSITLVIVNHLLYYSPKITRKP